MASIGQRRLDRNRQAGATTVACGDIFKSTCDHDIACTEDRNLQGAYMAVLAEAIHQNQSHKKDPLTPLTRASLVHAGCTVTGRLPAQRSSEMGPGQDPGNGALIMLVQNAGPAAVEACMGGKGTS